MSGNKERESKYYHCTCRCSKGHKYWLAIAADGRSIYYINSDEYIKKGSLGKVNIGFPIYYDSSLDELVRMTIVFKCSKCGKSFNLATPESRQLIAYARLNWKLRSLGY